MYELRRVAAHRTESLNAPKRNDLGSAVAAFVKNRNCRVSWAMLGGIQPVKNNNPVVGVVRGNEKKCRSARIHSASRSSFGPNNSDPYESTATTVVQYELKNLCWTATWQVC